MYERADGRVAAWGITFDDRTKVISLDGPTQDKPAEPEDALRAYSMDEHITARLVWVTPRPATPSDSDYEDSSVG